MFLLRRATARALAAPTFTAAKPRTFATARTPLSRLSQVSTLQRFQQRCYSNEVTKNAQESASSDSSTIPVTEDTPSETPSAIQEQAIEQSSPRESRAADANTVYLGNLYFEVTVEQIRELLSRYGSVTDVNIVRDPRGLSRGFAFATFEEGAQIDQAIADLQQQNYQGRRLVIGRQRAKQDRRGAGRDFGKSMTPNTPSKTLFIGNMSFEMTDKDLNELFKNIKNVLDVRVAIDRRTGQPRGFAHADFIDIASAEAAYEVLSGKVSYGRELRVDFSQSSSRNREQSANQ